MKLKKESVKPGSNSQMGWWYEIMPLTLQDHPDGRTLR